MVVQTHQVTTLHLTRQSISAWCGSCRTAVLMLTPDEAAAFTQTTTRDVYRRVETGELHSIETDDGALRVCVNSLGGTAQGARSDR
jgi:hypothetical protein